VARRDLEREMFYLGFFHCNTSTDKSCKILPVHNLFQEINLLGLHEQTIVTGRSSS
jgi:hypothetical protein